MSSRIATRIKAEGATALSFTRSPQQILQRKCACGGPVLAGGECAECRKKRLQTKLAVNQPGDRFEQEADRMAEFVVGGGRKAPAFSNYSLGALQRDEPKTPPKPDNYDEAISKILDALKETPVAKELQAKAAEMGKDFISSVEGKVIAGSALGGALGAIIATNSKLPMQIPELPLDFIAPGLKAKITWEGPSQSPTNAGLVLTTKSGVSVGASYTKTPASGGKPEEQKAGLTLTIPLGGSSEKKKGGPTAAEKYRAETARIAAEQEKFRQGMKTPGEKTQDQDFVDAYVRSKVDPTNPLGLPPLKKKEDPLLMRKAPNESVQAPATAPPVVDDVLRSPGEPLEAGTRQFFEERFGYDFGAVRVHRDARAAESARAVYAQAYTVGHDIVFDSGGFAPTTETGRRLLAHELTHVIQQRSGDNYVTTSPRYLHSDQHDCDRRTDRADEVAHRQTVTAMAKVNAVCASQRVLQRQVSGGNPAPATHSLPTGIQDLKGRDFQGVFRLDTISIIEFRTDCCQPCEELAQWLSGLAQKFRGVEHPFRVRFFSLNAAPMVVDATGHCIDELSSPEADENRALAKRVGITGGFPHLHIYLERKLVQEWRSAPPIEAIEEALNDIIENASMSGAEKAFHLGLGRSTGGWFLPFLLLPIAGIAALGGALFGKERGTQQLSAEKLQKVKDFGEGKIKPEDLDHSLAEDIINFWADHLETFKLDIDQRRLLIKNLMAGFTGDAEERAILKIIENSSDSEILQIFSLSDPDAPNLLELEAEFQGEERDYLDELLRHLRERFPVNPPQEKTTGLLIDDTFVKNALADAFRNTHRRQPNEPFIQRECCGVFIKSAQSAALDKEDKCEQAGSCETGIIAREALKKRGKGFQIAGSFHTHPVAFPPQAREAPSAADFKVFLADPARGKEHYVVGPLVTYLILRDGSFRILGNTADLLHVDRIQPRAGQVSTLELG